MVMIFRFPASRSVPNHHGDARFTCERFDTEAAENKINSILDGCKIDSISVTPVVARRHNNGGYDDVDLVYTVVYEMK